ncbi:MAG: hypothetical protein ACO31E_10430 [Phycisphaerales bacterium]
MRLTVVREGRIDGAHTGVPGRLINGRPDLAFLLSEWGPNIGRADLNRDTFVSGADLAILLANWGAH